MYIPIAVQLYSVGADARENLYGTLKKIKAMGYDGVEFAGLHGHTAPELKEMCADIGITPISAHVPYTEMVADPEGVLGAYAEIGVKYVAVPYLAEEHRPGTEAFPEVIRNIAMLGRVAKTLGITLMYHNHEFEFLKLDGKYALDILYDAIPAELLQTELDVCWIKLAGEDPVNYINKYADRCPIVHCKDFWCEELVKRAEDGAPARPRDLEFRPVGSGMNDIPAIVAAAKDGGAAWLVVEQDRPSMGLTALESIEKSLQYLKSINN